jgi:hypothetical protein
MSILFSGAAPYEFVNVSALVRTGATFDEDYVEGAISKTSFSDRALGRFFKAMVGTEVWLHGKVLLGASLASGTNGGPIFGFYDASNNFLGGLGCGNGTVVLSSGNTDLDVTSLITRNVLCDIDIHMFQTGSIRNVECYVNGNLISVAKTTATWVMPESILMGGFSASTNYFSEIIAIEGNEPTIGMRLHSKRPDPSLPGLNTFDSGFWGALANGTLTDGVVTSDPGARITGGFQPYTGPEEPLGIRGIVQSGRYLKNGTLLELKGQLRIADVNYDTPDEQFDDGNRLLTIWQENPATGLRFTVDDFAGLQGGFFTALPA